MSIKLKNIWVFVADQGVAGGGIVIAETEKGAKMKILEAYGGWEEDHPDAPTIMIWRLLDDENFSMEFPDVWPVFPEHFLVK